MGRISGWEDERVLEVDGGDESTTVWMCVMPLNYILKNGCSGKFGGMRILPKLKKNLQWLPIMLSTAYKALCDQASAGHSHLLSFSHSLGPRFPSPAFCSPSLPALSTAGLCACCSPVQMSVSLHSWPSSLGVILQVSALRGSLPTTPATDSLPQH